MEVGENGILEALDDAALSRAIEQNLTAYHRTMGRWPEIEVHEDTRHVWTVSARNWSLFNVVLEASLPPTDQSPEELESAIAELLQPFDNRAVNVMWKIGPSSRPRDIASRLERHGFATLPALKGMALKLDSWGPAACEEVTVSPLRNRRDLEDFREVVEAGFGFPSFGPRAVVDNLAWFGFGPDRPFETFLARFGGKPVASSQVFYGAGVAGLYYIATVPESRRQGFGRAATEAALLHARARGYRAAILHSTEMGEVLYRKIGFEALCDIELALRLADREPDGAGASGEGEALGPSVNP